MSETTFFNKIVYSAANEDTASELETLQITPQDQVLCISGSGARALDLLTAAPRVLLSVDFNPTQNHLLELKTACYKALTYEGLLRFVGVEADPLRWQTYQRDLRYLLKPETAAFWDRHIRKIKGGILYCGVWESYLKKMALITKVRATTLERMMQAETPEAQYAIWEQAWKGKAWDRFMAFLGQRWIWQYVLREPGIRYIDASFDMAEYMKARLDHIIRTQLIRTNPFLNLIIFGRYSREALPLHLQPEAFATIKNNLRRLKIITAPLTEVLAAHPVGINAFSLSDFSSYACPATYQTIWEAVLKAAYPGARVCERFFLVQYQPEQLFQTALQRNGILEAQLYHKDYAFIYKFNCAILNP